MKQQPGLEVVVRTMGTYLKKWGFTPQKPVKPTYQRNDPKVLEWLNQEYPSIKAPAKEEGAEIHWGDETGSVSMSANLKGYCPKGQMTCPPKPSPVVMRELHYIGSHRFRSL